MRRIYFLLIGIMMLGGAAHATTMCAANDSTPVVLDASIGGSNSNGNAELSEWYTIFSYGTVWGISACISTPSSATTHNLVDVDTDLPVVGGERTGRYCWCRMTHPALSGWAFRVTHSSVADCRSSCPRNCSEYVRDNASFRGGLFGSVGN